MNSNVIAAPFHTSGPSGIAISLALRFVGKLRSGSKVWNLTSRRHNRMIEALAIKPGDRVADLGAGGGYFTFRLAAAVGEAGQVYAVDVDAGMLSYLDDRIEREERRNVTTVRAAYEDPKLPEPVDMIFTSNTYHHLEERAAYFRRAQSYLKPGDLRGPR